LISTDPSQGRRGALVISLDFEIHWGVRELTRPDGSYRPNLIGVSEVVPRLLELFREFDIAATWATVGFLFATSRDELQAFSPVVKPEYIDPVLSPYQEPLGDGEQDDPFHYAPSLIEQIRSTPRQEIATHTFAHYYCLEPGQCREAFAADLRSALAIARARGCDIRSIVFPGNQHNAAYDDAIREAGLRCYRGTQKLWMYSTSRISGQTRRRRAARLMDSFVNVGGDHTTSWDSVWTGEMANVQASFFLRPTRPDPWRSPLRILQRRRISKSIQTAARDHRIVHIWWHPHNFGRHVAANIAELRRILEVFAECREMHGMRSLSMIEVAEAARSAR
jgi:peptidoglycan/xylan/chitin deacetylase (PgdA/CDA1 family)